MSVLVLSSGYNTAVLACVRNLGEHQLEVWLGDTDRFSITRASRYCSGFLLFPDAKKDPDKFKKILLDHLKKKKFRMVISIDEAMADILAKNQEEFRQYTRLGLPKYETFEIGKNKKNTFQFAEKMNITTIPKTYYIEKLSDLDPILSRISDPVVIKPQESSGSRGLTIVHDHNRIKEIYLRTHKRFPFPIIQDFIPPGGRKYQLCALFDSEHRVVAQIVQEVFREYPIYGGPATYYKTVRNDLIRDEGLKLLKAMKWVGPSVLEYKMDPRDHQPKLMEVNPRFWGTLHLSTFAGIDFPWIYYNLTNGNHTRPEPSYRENAACRCLLPNDILHFLTNPQRWRIAKSFFDFRERDMRFAVISRDDKGPAFAFFLYAFVSLFDKEKWRSFVKRS